MRFLVGLMMVALLASCGGGVEYKGSDASQSCPDSLYGDLNDFQNDLTSVLSEVSVNNRESLQQGINEISAKCDEMMSRFEPNYACTGSNGGVFNASAITNACEGLKQNLRSR